MTLQSQSDLNAIRETKQGSERPTSALSFMYDDITQRMKNIEEFGAPLQHLNRVLLTLLVQMRTDLTEEDHPVHLIVSAFQRIILEEVGKIKA